MRTDANFSHDGAVRHRASLRRDGRHGTPAAEARTGGGHAFGWLSTGMRAWDGSTPYSPGDRVINTGVDDVTRRWTLRLVVGLAAGAVLLSGCSEEQEASDTLPSAEASPSASQAELPPLGPRDLPMPAEARTQDAAGAQAFVRYYIDLINRTATVLDAAPLREFSDGCRDCSRIATNVEEQAAAGHDYEGGQIVIGELLSPVMREGEASVPLYVSQTPLTVRDASGTRLEDLSSDALPEMPAGIELRWDADRQTWLMQDFTVG